MNANSPSDDFFQQYMPSDVCFGCGHSNHDGLQIKSYWDGDECICVFKPEQQHQGWPGITCGGIISTLIDCHAGCTAVAHAYREEGREVGSAPTIWCATAFLKVDYLRPTPIEAPVTIRARVRETRGRKTWVECTLYSGAKECARGEVLAVQVPPEWGR